MTIFIQIALTTQFLSALLSGMGASPKPWAWILHAVVSGLGIIALIYQQIKGVR